MRRNTVQRTAVALLLLLQCIPCRLLFSSGTGRLRSVLRLSREHVRVTRTKLLHQALNHLHNIEALRVRRSNIGVEYHLQQHVAELFTQQRHVGLAAGFDRLDDLVGFLHEVADEGGVSLLSIPRTTTGCTQQRHGFHQGTESFSRTGGSVLNVLRCRSIRGVGSISHNNLPHRKNDKHSAPRRPPHGEPARHTLQGFRGSSAKARSSYEPGSSNPNAGTYAAPQRNAQHPTDAGR